MAIIPYLKMIGVNRIIKVNLLGKHGDGITNEQMCNMLRQQMIYSCTATDVINDSSYNHRIIITSAKQRGNEIIYLSVCQHDYIKSYRRIWLKFSRKLDLAQLTSRWGTTALRRVLRVADGGSPLRGDSEGLC